MNDADRTLELSSKELRGLIEAATERILAYIESLPRQPSGDSAGAAALARSLKEPLPETGRPAGELLDLLFEKVIPKGFNTAGPGYLAYIPGGGVPHAAVADLIAGATNRYVGVFAAAPGLAQIETNVVSWFCQIAGLSRDGAGNPDDGRVARELLGGRHRAARAIAREFSLRHDLRQRPGPPLHPEGGDARRFPGGERPGDSVGRALPDPGAKTWHARSRQTGRPDSSRFSSSATPAASTPARWTTSRRSRTSPPAKDSGSTWTAPTAVSFS